MGLFCSPEIEGWGGSRKARVQTFSEKNFSITNVHFGVQKGLGGRGLSIESRNFLRNICHFQSNLPFKSDFESHFTFKNLSLNSPEMEGGEGSSDQSPDFWWKDLRSRPSPDFTLWSPEIAKKGGE